uniref:GOST seven transmembrane domain-containing protein n=1 Tax=Octactis speculum TaxID=3111310 RepID=A0A7S2AS73_9STRA
MYSSSDAPSTASPGNGHSYLDFGSLELQTIGLADSTRIDSTVVNIAVFKATNFDHYDALGEEVSLGHDRQYCCTPYVQNLTGCHPDRNLIFHQEDLRNGSVSVIQVEVPHNGEPVRVRDVANSLSYGMDVNRYKVKSTGFYTLLLANCDYLSPMEILVTGESVWRNPYGYLPGELYGIMPFFGVMAGLYVVVGLIWLILCARNYNELMLLQFWISLVVGLGMVETCIKFVDYMSWNYDGARDTGSLISGLVFGVTKRALSRVLVLMVSLGYGVVKPSLGKVLPRILTLGCLYFALALCYDLLVNLPSTNKGLDRSGMMDSLTTLVVLMSLVDVAFYMWTLQAMLSTIRYLESRKQSVKLQLFRRFRTVLILSVLVSMAYAVYTMVASTESWFEEHWTSQWCINAVWEVLYLLILMAICILWMPSSNSQRYAYSMELATFDPDDDDEDNEGENMDDEYGGPLEEEPTVAANKTKDVENDAPLGAEKLA